MSETSKERLPHLLIKNSATAESYSRPQRGMGGTESQNPPRNRQAHAQQLLDKIQEIQSQETGIIEQQKAFGLDVNNGIYLAFESEPDFELKFSSLEFQPSGIELCSVKLVDNKTVATVFVPEGKLTHFLKKISQYQLENTPKNQPKNKDLIESITAIKLAAIDALWTDEPELMPDVGQAIWWEVWLRHSDRIDYEAFFTRPRATTRSGSRHRIHSFSGQNHRPDFWHTRANQPFHSFIRRNRRTQKSQGYR